MSGARLSSLRVEGGADNLEKFGCNLVVQARGGGMAFLMRQVTQAA